MATNTLSSAPQNSYSLDTVISDEILDELEAFREAWADRCGYDIGKMLAEAREFADAHPVAPLATIQPAEREPPKQ